MINFAIIERRKISNDYKYPVFKLIYFNTHKDKKSTRITFEGIMILALEFSSSIVRIFIYY